MAASCCIAGDNADRTRFVASAVAAGHAVLCAEIVAPGDAVPAIPAATFRPARFVYHKRTLSYAKALSRWLTI